MRILLATLLLCLGLAPALAQQVTVTSDHFEVAEAASEATFTGSVVVKRTGLTVWADKVVVAYASGGMEDIESMVATGNVRLKTDDQVATGQRAHFDPDSQVLRLTGNVVVENASGTVEGPELVVDLAANTSVFTGSQGSRVTGVFTPQ
ncbi:MAG TPA: lipopolysaccharide transport periplasmic protein LptA [Devosiaceae bacterium]|jgi:lipopolysaccharide export system protein LptA|nr:lipopolysaccharide transport periplasmic protein LptA [Devosiaceae bacterium]